MQDQAPRLTPGIWVRAQIRQCDVHLIPAVVRHKGREEAGAVLVKIDRFADGCWVYSRITDLDGRPAWLQSLGPVTDADAEAYIDRQRDIDPDLWVMEIEDPGGRYALDAPVVAL